MNRKDCISLSKTNEIHEDRPWSCRNTEVLRHSRPPPGLRGSRIDIASERLPLEGAAQKPILTRYSKSHERTHVDICPTKALIVQEERKAGKLGSPRKNAEALLHVCYYTSGAAQELQTGTSRRNHFSGNRIRKIALYRV